MNGRKKINDADRQLFREAVGPLRRMPERPEPPRPAPPPPRADRRERDEAPVEELLVNFDPAVMETGAKLAWLRDGHSPKLLRQLKRGHYNIGDELDLHHMNAQAARDLLRDFLEDAAAHGTCCVRVIHGKGLRSGSRGPVLKGLTDYILRKSNHVVAFASAPPGEGGTGAVLVLLKNY